MIKTLVAAACLMVLFLAACAPQAAPAPAAQSPAAAPAPAPVAPVVVAPSRPAWQEKWENTLAAARKEGELVVASSGGPDIRSWFTKGIKSAYGLNAEGISARSAELETKLITERRAGLYLEDVNIASPRSLVIVLKPQGVFQPLDDALILPEVTDPKVWYKGAIPWLDKDHLALAVSIYPGQAIAINTNLVKPDEMKSWRDLLDPKWKGKLVINDPTIAGAGSVAVAAMDLIMGRDYVKELANAQPLIVRDQRQQMDWLAHGKISVLIAPKGDMFTEFLQLGAPVAMIEPVEGTWLSCGSGSIAMFKNAPHPNAARVLVNWVLSKEGQELSAKTVLLQSAREDIPTTGLPQLSMRQAGKKYTPVYDEPALTRMLETDKLAKDLFTPLIK